MKKIKQLFRKGVALALTAVTTLSVFPANTISATSQQATITFAYCYDGNGNTIRYQQTASHNGVTFSHAGEARTRIYADGENAYCIEPGISLHTGNTLERDASVVWNNLGKAKQDAVNLALLYGAQGSMGSMSGTEDEKVLATQMVIWEIVTGCRNASAPYAQTDAKFYNSLCVGGANSGVAKAYNQVISGMISHATIPSFASGTTDSNPQELKWDGKQYVLKLTDSNGVLSKFNFTSSNSDVKVSASGNTLTITSSKAIAGTVRLSATKKIPTVSSSAKLIAYGDPSLQDVVTGVENTAAVQAYLNVKIPYGHVQIVKTSEDGVVAGLKFQITGNGIDQIVTTGEDGTIKVENLQPGTYTVTELTEKAMFLEYTNILNFFDCGATTKLTVIIRRLNKEELKEAVFIPMQSDRLDKYREEVNDMLMEKTVGANGMIRELYVTISVYRKNVEDARNYFLRTGNGLISHFSNLGSKCEELDAQEKLHVLHSFYRAGEESHFSFDMKTSAKLGHSFKDYICPDTMEFEKDYFKVGERYGRVLYLKDYASYISDTMVSEFADINQNMMISIDIIPIPTDEAVNEAQNRLLGVETNITNWQRRQNANQNFSATVPYDMELQKEESREFLRDLTTRDQRMMVAVVTLMHMAGNKKQLDADTSTILSVARNKMCQMAVLKFQQMDGMNTALPIGVRKIDSMRTLTTESLGSLIPFRTQEVMDKGGIYCGINAISHNLILVNRGLLLNPSAFILGVPGSGKSMLTKLFVLLIILTTSKDQVLIYDPEGEYEPLVQALGGVSLPICAGSDIHLNAMDMVKGYGDKNPIVDKSQFVLSLYERITDDRYIIGPKEKSILDRCVERVYSRKRQYEIPTFFTLRRVLQEQDEPEAKDLALMLELFTDGTLNNFSHPTNIETENRLISFNTRGMVEDMKDLGQLVITDHMINRVSQNWENGVRTHIFLDEFHTLLQHKYSANFFDSAYRRFRKRNAWTTSLTQNVEYVLDSLTARTMLSNSEFIVMLNQSASDREQLAELLHISGEQMKYITNARAGNGLARIGSALVPFYNQMNKNSEIYKLMSTKPEDFLKPEELL